MKKNNGFTLIELLVVIAIMSILTMITISQFTTARRKARDVSRKSDLNAVSKAINMYYADYGLFPTESILNLGDTGEFADKLVDGYVYMKVKPQEKPGFSPYCYVVSTDRKSFALFAALENTEDSDCKGNTYKHCGNQTYCYSVVSPNAVVGDLATFNP